MKRGIREENWDGEGANGKEKKRGKRKRSESGNEFRMNPFPSRSEIR